MVQKNTIKETATKVLDIMKTLIIVILQDGIWWVGEDWAHQLLR